jgi:FMN phosphatase YigB (HAD superfamily)
MYVSKNKTILVDCDGVLLDWEYSFHAWMCRHGYKIVENGFDIYKVNERYGIEFAEGKKLVRMFNESAAIRKLPPLRDAMKYVKKLHEEHGYVFHAITSLSNDTYSQYLRTKNLIELFGKTAFEKYTYLDTGADKDEALAEYEGSGCFWVEDKPDNAECGLRFGLDPILINHKHNENVKLSKGITRVNNWAFIYRMITH